MTEFKAGEYKTRDGNKAVVVFEIPRPHPSFGSYPLVGYYIDEDGYSMHERWEGDGGSLYHTSNDLMPNKRKIEQWIFSWASPERACVSVNDSEEGAIANKKRLEGWGWTCSEIVQAPVLEVEE